MFDRNQALVDALTQQRDGLANSLAMANVEIMRLSEEVSILSGKLKVLEENAIKAGSEAV